MPKLCDLVEIKHGFAFKGKYFRDAPPGDILLTPGNFAIGGGFQWAKVKHYVGPVPEDYVLDAGDLLVTMTDLSKNADTLGYPALVPGDEKRYLHNQRLGKVVIKEGAPVRKPFLYWLMRTREYRNEVLASHTGSTVKHTSPTKIGNFEFSLPTLDKQDAIAAVLGALEDKIDLNRRTNETLEAMARAVFKSWFVDFDPVHAKAAGKAPAHMDAETAALFPNALGEDELPAGWSWSDLEGLCEINPRETLKRGVEAPYVDMASLPTRGPSVASAVERAFSSGSKFRNGDTLLARITPCLENGKTAYVDNLPDETVGWGSTEFIVIRPRPPVPAAFGYLLARTGAFREHAIRSMTGTSGRQRVQISSLSRYELARATPAVLAAFGELVDPWFELIRATESENQTLIKLRDLLLPKLMSGEVGVHG